MENGDSCGSGNCKPFSRADGPQATQCGQGCEGSGCQETNLSSAPIGRRIDCSSIYCDPASAARRTKLPSERKMCVKCKTSRAEVGCCSKPDADACSMDTFLWLKAVHFL